MKEELTTKMHSEFTVSRETDIKHKSFAVLGLIDSGMTVEKVLNFSGVAFPDIKEHLVEFNELYGANIVLKAPKRKP